MTPRPLIFALFALLCVAGMARTEPTPASGGQRVPLGDGRVLTVSVPKRLTSHADIQQFMYRPHSREVVYSGTTINGDTARQTVCMVNFDTGITRPLLQYIGPLVHNSFQTPRFSTVWTSEGRYLLVSHFQHTASSDVGHELDFPVWDSVDLDGTRPVVRRLALPQDSKEKIWIFSPLFLSPSGSRFVQQQRTPASLREQLPSSVFLYDPSADTVQRLSLPGGYELTGWTDNTHLRVHLLRGGKPVTLSRDIATGTEMPTLSPPAETILAPSVNAGVQLYILLNPLDIPGPDTKSYAHGYSVWLTVKAVQSNVPAVLLFVFTEKGFPQALLTPDGSAALWVQNGDLYACTFAVVPTTGTDKAAGR